MKNEKVSFASVGRLILMLLFCGLCGMAVYGLAILVNLPIPKEIARMFGIFIGFRLWGVLFTPKTTQIPIPVLVQKSTEK
jgi:hypothetical protein